MKRQVQKKKDVRISQIVNHIQEEQLLQNAIIIIKVREHRTQHAKHGVLLYISAKIQVEQVNMLLAHRNIHRGM